MKMDKSISAAQYYMVLLPQKRKNKAHSTDYSLPKIRARERERLELLQKNPDEKELGKKEKGVMGYGRDQDQDLQSI